MLNNLPILNAATDLTVTLGDPIDTSTTTLVRNTDYFEDAESGVLVKGSLWGKGRSNIRVQYHAGFATIPLDVEIACNMLVTDWYLYPSRVPIRYEGISGASAGYVETLLAPMIKELLSAYRNKRIG